MVEEEDPCLFDLEGGETKDCNRGSNKCVRIPTRVKVTRGLYNQSMV